jgi:beta-phosphoglucomutase-like phosphatase (HAD superfamily)
MSVASVRLVIFDCDGVLVDSEPMAMRILLETDSEAGLDVSPRVAYPSFLGKRPR